ncbi:hypothetical protein MRB53_003892 [Persea americana]|uniref:Uncharacterized protein n=1 Tax=Persea americana TaxID=3435 RepID=A0ACC2MYT1_PERAE|nr:hypothetical protein MRB53_003892 [Persea americana]
MLLLFFSGYPERERQIYKMPHRQRSAAYPPELRSRVGTGRLSSRVIEGTLTLLLSLSEVLPSNRRRIDPAVEKLFRCYSSFMF